MVFDVGSREQLESFKESATREERLTRENADNKRHSD